LRHAVCHPVPEGRAVTEGRVLQPGKHSNQGALQALEDQEAHIWGLRARAPGTQTNLQTWVLVNQAAHSPLAAGLRADDSGEASAGALLAWRSGCSLAAPRPGHHYHGITCTPAKMMSTQLQMSNPLRASPGCPRAFLRLPAPLSRFKGVCRRFEVPLTDACLFGPTPDPPLWPWGRFGG